MLNLQSSIFNLKCILHFPCATESYLQDTRVAEINDTAIVARLQVVVGIALTVKIRSYLISGDSQLCGNSVH